MAATEALAANTAQLSQLVLQIGATTKQLQKFPSIAGTDTSGHSIIKDANTIAKSWNDIAQDPQFAGVLAECRERLLRICDPAAVDARAKERQAQLLEQHGGRDAVIKRGDLGFSPPPGYPIVLG